MHKLFAGHLAFHARVFSARRDLFQRLTKGQAPLAMFITCSDSRIVPSLLTQTDPGDLFELRNAGNFVPRYRPSAEAATIEFAVEGLGIRDIVVCGHTQCGAMQELLLPLASRGLPAMQAWLQHGEAARRAALERHQHLKGSALIDAAARENVLVQLGHLRAHPVVEAAMRRGQLQLHGWMYHLDGAMLHVFDPASGDFMPMLGGVDEN